MRKIQSGLPSRLKMFIRLAHGSVFHGQLLILVGWNGQTPFVCFSIIIFNIITIVICQLLFSVPRLIRSFLVLYQLAPMIPSIRHNFGCKGSRMKWTCGLTYSRSGVSSSWRPTFVSRRHWLNRSELETQANPKIKWIFNVQQHFAWLSSGNKLGFRHSAPKQNLVTVCGAKKRPSNRRGNIRH